MRKYKTVTCATAEWVRLRYPRQIEFLESCTPGMLVIGYDSSLSELERY